MIHEDLLRNFDNLVEQLLLHRPLHFHKIKEDAYGYHAHQPGKYDLFLNCGLHGNEIAGLSIVNALLDAIIKKKTTPQLNIIFCLANREAVKKNRRQINRDLNRSFHVPSPGCAEEERASELEDLAQQAHLVLDLHQTTADAISPFFLLRPLPANLNLLNLLKLPNWPVVLYKEGNFSADGSSFSTSCFKNAIPFITVELGLVGLQPEFEQLLVNNLITIITCQTPLLWRHSLSQKPAHCANDFFQEAEVILKVNADDHLVPGMKNLSPVKIGAELYYQNNTIIKSNGDYFVLFPKYGIYRDTSSELVRLLRKVKL